jgi:uroporphyrinogen-III synthase
MKIKSILIAQPKPESEKSPYIDLAKKYKLKVDFVPFFRIEGVSAKEFRKERINLADYSCVIFTSRYSIDHYFRLCPEMRFEIPETMKYFCISETIAPYIQKYTQYKKRRVFCGRQNIYDLVPFLQKHKEEKFLLPCSNVHNKEIDAVLDKEKINYRKALLFRTIPANLSDVKISDYDMLVFFSPADVKSLKKNFPKFKQKETIIAAFGTATEKAVQSAKLRLDILAPTPGTPSMTMAIEKYLNAKAKK